MTKYPSLSVTSITNESEGFVEGAFVNPEIENENCVLASSDVDVPNESTNKSSVFRAVQEREVESFVIPLQVGEVGGVIVLGTMILTSSPSIKGDVAVSEKVYVTDVTLKWRKLNRFRSLNL